MKHELHTKEWIADTRKRARLSMEKLAQLAGVHTNTAQYAETGARNISPSTWSKLDKVLYQYVPAAYVDEDALIETIRTLEDPESRAGDLCRLYYAVGNEGVAFTNVRTIRDESLSVPCVILSWSDARKLLEAQKQAFEREQA